MNVNKIYINKIYINKLFIIFPPYHIEAAQTPVCVVSVFYFLMCVKLHYPANKAGDYR